jgi:parallel beta-helix repeat protein
MKTLTQIEPRTSISSLPYTITNAGSYYLTTNLTGLSGANGITIASGNVALDLRGFTLSGVPGSQDGIYVSGAYNNVTVENGTVGGWGSIGVSADNGSVGQFSHLRLVGNGSDGLDPGSVSQVSDCIASGNGGYGFGGFCSNSKFEGCLSTGNNYSGFSTFEGCLLQSCSANLNGLDGFSCFVHCTVRDCVAHDNGFDGVDMPYTGGGGVVAGCVCNNNGSQGIITADGFTIKDSVATGNGLNGITAGVACSVLACTVQTNGVAGILVSTNSLVKDCTADYNVKNGIQAGTGCLIEHNTCSVNGGGNTGDGGIRCTGSSNRVDSNHLTGNNANGLYLDGSGNTIVRNSAKVNISTNYFVGAGNDVGPIGSAATSTSPWANLQ